GSPHARRASRERPGRDARAARLGSHPAQLRAARPRRRLGAGCAPAPEAYAPPMPTVRVNGIDTCRVVGLCCTSPGSRGGASYPLHELANLPPEARIAPPANSEFIGAHVPNAELRLYE